MQDRITNESMLRTWRVILDRREYRVTHSIDRDYERAAKNLNLLSETPDGYWRVFSSDGRECDPSKRTFKMVIDRLKPLIG